MGACLGVGTSGRWEDKRRGWEGAEVMEVHYMHVRKCHNAQCTILKIKCTS
jgi:hypothetical protein